MKNDVEVVGSIKFGNYVIDVYDSLDEPLFKASDIAETIEYSESNTWRMVSNCEEDEVLKLQMVVAGQRRHVTFITERGLYNVLSQSKKHIARGWRRIIHDEIIALRKSRNMDIQEQFQEWDHALDDVYFDEETGVMMQSVTVEGGDVIQVPYKGE